MLEGLANSYLMPSSGTSTLIMGVCRCGVRIMVPGPWRSFLQDPSPRAAVSTVPTARRLPYAEEVKGSLHERPVESGMARLKLAASLGEVGLFVCFGLFFSFLLSGGLWLRVLPAETAEVIWGHCSKCTSGSSRVKDIPGLPFY